MAKELGLDGGNTNVEVELFEHPIVKLQDELSQARLKIQQLERENQNFIKELNQLFEEKEKIRVDLITSSLNENSLRGEVKAVGSRTGAPL